MSTLVQQQEDRSWGRVTRRTVVSPTTGSLIATPDLLRALQAGNTEIASKFACALAENDTPPMGQRRVKGTERFEESGGKVFLTYDWEPIPPKPILTTDQKLDRMAEDYEFADADELASALEERRTRGVR